MLVRHGYGVLVFDRRGEGTSEGDPNALGWGFDDDLRGAIAYLRGRDDVDSNRIGGPAPPAGAGAARASCRRPPRRRLWAPSCPKARATGRSARTLSA